MAIYDLPDDFSGELRPRVFKEEKLSRLHSVPCIVRVYVVKVSAFGVCVLKIPVFSRNTFGISFFDFALLPCLIEDGASVLATSLAVVIIQIQNL